MSSGTHKIAAVTFAGLEGKPAPETLTFLLQFGVLEEMWCGLCESVRVQIL